MEQSKPETPATTTATVPATVPVTVTVTAAETKQVEVPTKAVSDVNMTERDGGCCTAPKVVLAVIAENSEVMKKKRGRPAKGTPKVAPPPKQIKKEDEDVCFICFDGGSLVLCDRR